MKTKIIITTGGTGGHIFPAQTIAKKLSEQNFRVVVFGDKNYAKYHKPTSPYQSRIISSSKLNKSPVALVKAVIKISWGIFQSLILLLKYQPKVVVAFGGYSTFPVLVAAIILRKKIILHEQNAHLGKVNRIFAKFAAKIALSYEQTDGFEREKNSEQLFLAKKGIGDSQSLGNDTNNKFVFTGNPVREEILALQNQEYQLPDFNEQLNVVDNLGYDVLLASQFYKHNKNGNENTSDNPFHILVVGGSGGAKIFSDVLPKALFNLRDEIKNRISITQQCRLDLLPATLEQYQSFNLNIVISNFFDNMVKEIAKAHLVIARSGSSSVAELTCAKKPMILVPFALAADNHQEKNAQQLEKAGGAIVIKEQNFTINNITSTIEKLIDNPALLQKMSSNAFKCAVLDAGENLTKLIVGAVDAS